MDRETQSELKSRFMSAVDGFIDKIRNDQNILSVIVSGSLAYDVVWEKSDIDVTVIVRDQILKNSSYCIVEDDITMNVYLMTRSEFKRGMERNIGGSLSQSYFSKGKMVYTTDDSLYEYFEDLKKIGRDDIALSVFQNACNLVFLLEKSQKWLTARKDTLYAQYFLLKAAEVIANIELCKAGEPISRESIQKALKLNPEAIAPFYQNAMSHHLSEEEITHTIHKIDLYLEQNIDMISSPVVEFLSDGEIKTVTLISKHFHTDGHFLVEILEYLAGKGIIEKVSQTIRITPKGRQSVEEIGYQYIPEGREWEY